VVLAQHGFCLAVPLLFLVSNKEKAMGSYFYWLLLLIVVVEETRLYLDRKANEKLRKKYTLLMQEHQVIEAKVAKYWARRTSYELG
jgi:hypothetical protein